MAYINKRSSPAATTNTTLYTVPAATETVINTMVVCNRGAAMTYRIALRPLGAALADAHYLAYDGNLGANESLWITVGITMIATDLLIVYASHGNSSFQAFGKESAA